MTPKIYQPHPITRMTQGFDSYAKSLMTFNTSTTPDMKVSNDLQKRYRSGVGSLIYLVKHSRTELSNEVWELST